MKGERATYKFSSMWRKLYFDVKMDYRRVEGRSKTEVNKVEKIKYKI